MTEVKVHLDKYQAVIIPEGHYLVVYGNYKFFVRLIEDDVCNGVNPLQIVYDRLAEVESE